jgi:hypothetical protein
MKLLPSSEPTPSALGTDPLRGCPRSALVLIRRALVLAALMFWQGGFTFYAGVVVPIGTEVFGSAAGQASITRRVAGYLNLSGAVALVLFAWDAAAARPGPWLRRGRWLAWGAMAVCLVALLALHPQLDRMFHGEEAYLTDRAAFRPWHRAYLWTSTVQWGCAIVFAVLTLAAWRAEDRG